jgi:hypothetical protein
MGKRSDFPRRPMDSYDTPEEAVLPLLPFLMDVHTFAEPCAGNGFLIRALEKHGLKCVWASDLRADVRKPVKGGIDALKLTRNDLLRAEAIISNPPWTRELLHPMIKHFMRLKPTWLLFDADWMHNQQAVPFIVHCRAIVSVGRVKWMDGSAHTGLDNAAWFLFDHRHIGQPLFHPRMV